MLFLFEHILFIYSLYCVMNIQNYCQDVPWSMTWQYPFQEKNNFVQGICCSPIMICPGSSDISFCKKYQKIALLQK